MTSVIVSCEPTQSAGKSSTESINAIGCTIRYVTIVVRVTSVGSFLNSASVAGDPADPNTANNTATARVTGTPPPSTCVDTRRFTFKLHKFRKARIVDAVLFINGVRKAHKRGHDLKTITIAKLPLGNFTVKIVSTQSTHSTLTSTRAYMGCIKGRPRTVAHHAHPHHHHHG